MKKTLFITFEGGEGSGKTTQSKRLVEYLKSKGHNAIWTREVGGTEVAEKIREVMLHNSMDALTELLLVMAARREHIENVIKPALKANAIVVCDRFVDSTLCYQGDIVGRELVLRLHNELLESFMPDITFFIDVPVKDGLQRALERGTVNKFESQDISKHEKIRDNFLSLCQAFPNRIHKIDGLNSLNKVTEDILRIVGL